jgi:uncharacterized membrane protein YphA (DoxX/SURF4 family)
MNITLTQLLIFVGIIAILLTLLVGFAFKKHKSWILTFLQNYCGVLFVISGLVKAVDPMGTAFKMEQYFGEFYYTFSETAFSFLAPVFPFFSKYAIAFSVFMIIFEILLGLMLILGMKSKWTSWAFLLLVGFFTFLTGFTYLTGYVPSGVNFFSFGQWGPWVESNMKVTDCGCFGDFIKLVPKTSFLKDVVLLFPAVFFVFKHKDMHELFSNKVRWAILGIVGVGLLYYCFSNYVWDIPKNDFRPFKKGVNILKQKEIEENAMANVEILGWKLKNKNDNTIVELPNAQYMKEFANYPKTDWETEQIKSEPTIVSTKISEYEVTGPDGYDISEDLLLEEGYSFMIVAYKLKGEVDVKEIMVKDTSFIIDTSLIIDPDTYEETIKLVKVIDKISDKKVKQETFTWNPKYQNAYKEVVNPIAEAAEKAGIKTYAVVGGAGKEMIEDFRHSTQSAFPFYTSDEILLKTIVRSNPGIVLFKDGTIVDKWHYKQVPSFEEIKAKYIK